MSTSPTKSPFNASPAPSSQHGSIGRSAGLSHPTRTIRKFQSAHTLSTGPSMSNHPSLISQQRQQQQQQQQQSRVAPSVKNETPHTSLDKPQGLSFAQRTRANSDAPVAGISFNGPHSKRAMVGKRVVSNAIASPKKSNIDHLLRDGPPEGNLTKGLQELRFDVLADGVQSDSDGMSSLRIYIWLILLNAPPLATDLYLDLVHRGPSPAYSKIRNDTFRTLATDPLFRRRVSEASLIRMLNAIAWKLHDAKEERLKSLPPSENQKDDDEQNSALSPKTNEENDTNRKRSTTIESSDTGGSEPGIYVQGMNVLAAPFLYAARSEAEAFTAFHRFLTTECPGYVRGAMDGVHRGLALVDKILAIVDPKLSTFLLSKGMRAELYAFPSVLTLCACTPPLPEVLHLWDFLFAYGAHLNIMCIVAQLVLIRDSIIGSPSPTKVLRSFPPLNAAKIIALAISLGQKLPDTVYNELVSHGK